MLGRSLAVEPTRELDALTTPDTPAVPLAQVAAPAFMTEPLSHTDDEM
jgi:hypothetical protein